MSHHIPLQGHNPSNNGYYAMHQVKRIYIFYMNFIPYLIKRILSITILIYNFYNFKCKQNQILHHLLYIYKSYFYSQQVHSSSASHQNTPSHLTKSHVTDCYYSTDQSDSFRPYQDYNQQNYTQVNLQRRA